MAGRSGGGGLRVGSYTPASYGSATTTTTFGPSSYQYRVGACVWQSLPLCVCCRYFFLNTKKNMGRCTRAA